MARSSTQDHPGGRLAPPPVERRDFLGLAGLWSAGLAIVGSIVGMLRLPKPRVLPEPSGKIKVGKASEFPPGTVRVVPGKNVRLESRAEGLVALSLTCTHLGCIVVETKDDPAHEDGHHCPCHGSRFGVRGEVTQGPAPRPLRWLEISRAPDGSLLVDVEREVPLGTYFTM